MADARRTGNPSTAQNGAYGSNPTVVGMNSRVPTPQTQGRGVAQSVEQVDTAGLPEGLARSVVSLQRQVQSATDQTKSGPFANGNLVANWTFVNGSISGGLPIASTLNVIPHGLGRVPQGYMVVDMTGGYFAFLPVRYAWDDKTITLFGQKQNWSGSANVTISLYVF